LDEPGVELLVKLEAANPGGSAKDRPARQMLEQAISDGLVDRCTTVVESSSGNMGIGLAQACRYHGLAFVCVVDPHAQPQNIAIMRALGAEIAMVSDQAEGSFLEARLQRVHLLLRQRPNSFWPNQYANRHNPAAHEMGTICEIDRQVGGNFDYLFVATSSTGTAQGCRNYLRQQGRRTKIIAVDAHGSVLFGGTHGTRHIPGLGASREPALAHQQTFDRVCRVSDIDCVVGCRRAARRVAVLIGGWAGGLLDTGRGKNPQIVGSRGGAEHPPAGIRYIDTGWDE
jgi:cysteine synthase A